MLQEQAGLGDLLFQLCLPLVGDLEERLLFVQLAGDLRRSGHLRVDLLLLVSHLGLELRDFLPSPGEVSLDGSQIGDLLLHLRQLVIAGVFEGLELFVLLDERLLELGDHLVAGRLRRGDVRRQPRDLLIETGLLGLELVEVFLLLLGNFLPVDVRRIDRDGKAHEHQAHDEDTKHENLAEDVFHGRTTALAEWRRFNRRHGTASRPLPSAYALIGRRVNDSATSLAGTIPTAVRPLQPPHTPPAADSPRQATDSCGRRA